MMVGTRAVAIPEELPRNYPRWIDSAQPKIGMLKNCEVLFYYFCLLARNFQPIEDRLKTKEFFNTNQ